MITTPTVGVSRFAEFLQGNPVELKKSRTFILKLGGSVGAQTYFIFSLMIEHFYSSIANFMCKFHVTNSLFMSAVAVQNWTYIIIIIFMTVVSI